MESEASVVRTAPQPSIEFEVKTNAFDPKKAPPRSVFLVKLATRLAAYN